MINIDKLKQIQHDILNSDDDKKDIIKLFNRQLSLLDKVTDEFDICYEIAQNIDEAITEMQKYGQKQIENTMLNPLLNRQQISKSL